MRQFKGFTLIELLVVIAIIALLLAILTPALRFARGLGQQAVCASHLKSLGLASAAYAGSTRNGVYVPFAYYDRQADEWVTWAYNKGFRSALQIDAYMDTKKGVDVSPYDMPDEFLCPSDRISKDPKNKLSGVLLSYGYNYTEWRPKGGWFPPVTDLAAHTTDKLKDPAEKLMFIDGIDWWVEWTAADYAGKVRDHDGWGWDRLGQAKIKTYKDKGFHGPTFYRHFEGANVLFYDGHVEHRDKEEIFVVADFEAKPPDPGMWVMFIDEWLKRNNNTYP